MKTELIMVGKTTDKHFQASTDEYVRRVVHYMPFSLTVRLLQPGDTVVLLDEHGQELRSIELARWLEQKRQTARRLVFVIGGPYGFSPAVYARANEKLSLSRLTFSHQMVRLVFVEQLYRACTIIKGEPYHHE